MQSFMFDVHVTIVHIDVKFSGFCLQVLRISITDLAVTGVTRHSLTSSSQRMTILAKLSNIKLSKCCTLVLAMVLIRTFHVNKNGLRWQSYRRTHSDINVSTHTQWSILNRGHVLVLRNLNSGMLVYVYNGHLTCHLAEM